MVAVYTGQRRIAKVRKRERICWMSLMFEKWIYEKWNQVVVVDVIENWCTRSRGICEIMSSIHANCRWEGLLAWKEIAIFYWILRSLWKGISGLFSSFFESFFSLWHWRCQVGIGFFRKTAHWSQKPQHPAVWYDLLFRTFLFSDSPAFTRGVFHERISSGVLFTLLNFILWLIWVTVPLFLHGWKYNRLPLNGSRCAKKEYEIRFDCLILKKILKYWTVGVNWHLNEGNGGYIVGFLAEKTKEEFEKELRTHLINTKNFSFGGDFSDVRLVDLRIIQ